MTLCIKGGFFIPQLYGNIHGLKANQLKRLEHIYRRRIPHNLLITPELGRYLTELSQEIGRQIGIIVNRKGSIIAAIVGDEKEIVIPVLADYPLGRKRLRGLRCIHTHLKNEPLSQDDLTDLALLRLDIMAAIGILEDGLPSDIFISHLLPLNPEGKTFEIHPPVQFHRMDLKSDEFILALEEEMGRAVVRDIKDKRERAILISASRGDKEEQLESIEELKELSRSANVAVLDTIIQRPKELNPKYLMGSGKLKELIIKALQKEATLLIFDQELTPTQIREIGEITELKVIDRTQLILDIFAGRAHSRDGKVEVDRRRVQDKISHLEKQLKSLSRGRLERRRRRGASGVPIISIVGYTNVGKTTLLNTLTKSETRAEDLLFATLDTASRRLRFPRERDTVITDTVGFIRHLPKDLLKAFKATLEEMQDADLLIHLADISSPNFEKQIEVVENILKEIGLDSIERVLVFNKTDKISPEITKNLCRRYNAIAISAIHPTTLGSLLKILEERLWHEDMDEAASSPFKVRH